MTRTMLCCLLLVWSLAVPASAEQGDPESAIRNALERWRIDFNGRKADAICDLFSPELIYDFRGLPEQNYALLCERLHRALSGTGPTFRYGLRIKEVIVSGDLGVVRLTWISTVTANGQTSTDEEPGLDVFRRGTDGQWRIIRYIAYTADP
jgi:ketosteroid isomerase-like protein